MNDLGSIETSWNAEYEARRYEGEPPIPFVESIVKASQESGLAGAPGLYIGCGNGRNFLPLVDRGLDLIGLDVSWKALGQLARLSPKKPARLIHGDLSSIINAEVFDLIIGLQVFQHGDRAGSHAHIKVAQRRLRRNGLFCLRVNSTITDIDLRHEELERHPDGGRTVRYLEGPKAGLCIHFFGREELEELFVDDFETVEPLRLSKTLRVPPRLGHWGQWESIWRRT